MKPFQCGVAVAALIALGSGVALAQEEEPSTAAAHDEAEGAREKTEPARVEEVPAAQDETQETADDTTNIAPRKRRHRHRRARAVQGEAQPPAGPREASLGHEAAVPHEAALPTVAQPAANARPTSQPTPAEHKGAAAAPGSESGPGRTHGPTGRDAGHGVVSAAHAGPAEHGADHEKHVGFSVKTFVFQLVNFGILLFILIRFGGRAMNKSLQARHDQLKSDIQEAARLRDEATRKFEAQEKRVADLEEEIASLRASIRQDAEREQTRLIEGAQERAKWIQEEMRMQLNRQVKEAESLLRSEVASASVKLAEELVRKAMNTDDERRLAKEFVAGFDRPTAPGEAVR